MVPDYVDQTMLDSIPLTVLEHFDWGDDSEQNDYEG